MTSLTHIEKMTEINNLLFSLMVNNMTTIGNENERLLKSLPEEQGVSPQDDVTLKSINRTIDTVVLDILQLIDFADDICLKAVANYDSILKNIIDSFPQYQKTEMPEGTKRLLDSLWLKKDNSIILSSILANFTNTLHTIYTFQS